LKLRDRKGGKWFIDLSERFERNWNDDIEAKYGECSALLDFLVASLETDPRNCGEKVDVDGQDEIWAWETPPIGVLPIVYVAYKIIDDDRRVQVLSVTALPPGAD
jgi:hypothetical protein